MQDVIIKGRAVLAKATAAYATYKTTAEMARKAAEMYCHVWSVHEDYAWALFEASSVLIHRSRVNVFWKRADIKEHTVSRSDADRRFGELEWVWLSVPGTSRMVQARYFNEAIEFRSALRRDLDVIRAEVDVIAEEIAEAAPRVDFEFGPSKTEIWSWDSKTNEWDCRKSRTSRSFNSVLIPAELQADIENDLKQFTKSKERLQRIEIPWRRGYLLEGPPGTGKTSLALAIAGTLGFRLASLSLTDIKSDGMLRQAVSQLRANTVLVIEDIDAYSVSRDRDHNTATDGDLSLSGLLNSLDGFETPDGLVTICTTNHVEQLDPALIRAGRLDRIFTLDYIEAPEVERLFAWFYETEAEEESADTADAELSPAAVSEIFKQHFEDAEAGWNAVQERIIGQEATTLAAA